MNIPWDDVAVVVITAVAVLLNLACHNDRQIVESPLKTAARRLIMVGQSLLIVRVAQVVFEFGSSNMSKPILFILLLWGLGEIMSSLDYIVRRWGRDMEDLLKPRGCYERRKHSR